MSKLLNTQQIMDRMEDMFFDGDPSDRDGDYVRGRLRNGRGARIRVMENDGMLNVQLLVPGSGDMGIGFSLFAEDATVERIDRFIAHAEKAQKRNMERWEEIYG